jgi:hypothetical protein
MFMKKQTRLAIYGYLFKGEPGLSAFRLAAFDLAGMVQALACSACSKRDWFRC